MTRHSGCDVSNTGRMHTTAAARRAPPAWPSLAGCGGSPSDTSAGTTVAVRRARTRRPRRSTRLLSGAAPTPSGPARCTVADLRVALSGGEGAAGSTYYLAPAHQHLRPPCRTGGFGGVSLVGDGDGTQIGAPADRTEQASCGRSPCSRAAAAEATLRVTNAENYPARSAAPRRPRGSGSTRPNETHVGLRRPAAAPAAATTPCTCSR